MTFAQAVEELSMQLKDHDKHGCFNILSESDLRTAMRIVVETLKKYPIEPERAGEDPPILCGTFNLEVQSAEPTILVGQETFRKILNERDELRQRRDQLLASNNRLTEERRAADKRESQSRENAEQLRLGYEKLREEHCKLCEDIRALFAEFGQPLPEGADLVEFLRTVWKGMRDELLSTDERLGSMERIIEDWKATCAELAESALTEGNETEQSETSEGVTS